MSPQGHATEQKKDKDQNRRQDQGTHKEQEQDPPRNVRPTGREPPEPQPRTAQGQPRSSGAEERMSGRPAGKKQGRTQG